MNKTSVIFLLLAVLLFNNKKINAQHKNNLEAGLFNIGFGGFIGGLGAILNKKPNEKTGKVFLKGFSQGALGGYLLFESKCLVGKYGKTGNYSYIWPSKLINSAGVSIIENAASNRSFGERWHLNIGFNRFEIFTKNKFKISYRVMPFALSSTIYGFTQGHLSINESIKTGTFVFTTNRITSEGLTLSNTIFLLRNRIFSKQLILSHELVHTYQFESFSSLNPYLDKPINNLKINNDWLKKYSKIFHTDFNFLTFGIFYELNANNSSNFFEREAQFYTEKK
ncbi:MAG TPA: hypothetical protein ENK46_06405 [Flavobacteriia bacterium]|nr:hypothetical protein [Flavobacteriia bacterium]